MDKFTFFTDAVSIKTETSDGEKKYYVEGYASTNDLDLVNDIVTDNCLQDMMAQIKGKNIKIDVEHEAWKDSSNIIPVGKVVDARIDKKGLWVKVLLNKSVGRFKEVWESVKGGFLDAFSIAFQVVEKADKMIGEKTVRLLEKVNLLNIALTGNPANPEARITAVMAKSLTAEYGGNTMEEKNIEQKDDAPTPAAEVAPEESVVEEAEAKETEEPVAEESTAEVKEAFKTTIDELKEEVKNLTESNNKEIVDLKARLKAAEEALSKPVLKARVEETPMKAPEKIQSALDAIY